MVNVQQLLLLLSFCADCGCQLISRSFRFNGACFIVDYICQMGHNNSWLSSPMNRRQYTINSLIACTTTLSGIRFASIQHFMNLIRSPCISEPVFNRIRKVWLFPVIYRSFINKKAAIIQKIKSSNVKLVLCGDGQYDSPGFSAKFCTYSIMNCDTNEVIDFCVIQKGQFTTDLERHACQQLMHILVHEYKLDIGSFVSDRHTSIGAMMTEMFTNIFHAYDIWHMAKSLIKTLTKSSKKHPKIAHWQNSLITHFWWSTRTCKGNVDLLLEMFHSCLLHVQNIHNWSRRTKIFQSFADLRGNRPYPKKPVLMKKCYHRPLLVKDSEEVQWFKVEDDDFKALFKVISGTKYSNDMRKCCKFIHTGKLESFHNVKLTYLPKSTGFTMTTTIALTMLAALQNNIYLEESSLIRTFQTRAWSRAKKKYILKTRRIYDNVSFKVDLLNEVQENISNNNRLSMDLTHYIRQSVPKTFHKQTAPDASVLLAEKKSRMK